METTIMETDERLIKTRASTPSSVKEKPLWREYLEISLLALLATVLLRLFVVSGYRVSSASMEGEMYEGDYLFVSKLAYEYPSWFGGVEVGDIIVFKYPNNPNKDFIKRVVALPEQTVQVVNKVLYVDEKIVGRPPEAKNTDGRILPGELSFRDNFGPYTVPIGEYFVMGDNRDDSRDSRFWGSVPHENIRGRAVFVYWSWEPAPTAPSWQFPYVIDAVQWLGYGIYNFPSHVRWDRLGHIFSDNSDFVVASPQPSIVTQ